MSNDLNYIQYFNNIQYIPNNYINNLNYNNQTYIIQKNNIIPFRNIDNNIDYKNFDNQIIPQNNYTNYNQNNMNNSIDNYDYLFKNNIDIRENLCGIKNYGYNCYLNSGLQILVSCERFLEELNKCYIANNRPLTTLLKDALFQLQNVKKYDPKRFLTYFSAKNSEFYGVQSCSQNFIRTLLKKVNEELLSTTNLITESQFYKPPINEEELKNYYYFITSNKIFPETTLLSIFSGITKSYYLKNCDLCQKKLYNIEFSYFIDQNIYLDEFKSNTKYKFKDILMKNFEKAEIKINCPYCNKENIVSEETKIIKLPEILIFTLERYQGEYNDVQIETEDYIDVKNYVDTCLSNTKDTKIIYELFAINIRLGKTKNFGHEICQVKRNGIWYEFNDEHYYVRTTLYNQNSYGLFYKRVFDIINY